MRFAMVTTFYPPYHFGGDAIAVRALTHALARRGHEVHVIHDVDAYRALHRGPEPEPLREPAGVQVHALRSRLGAFSAVATHQTGRPVVHGGRIRRILNRDFDVIHFHNVSLVGGPGVLSYGRGVKLYTAHEHWLVCPTHILWRHRREVCTERECLRCVLRHGRPPQVWRSTSFLHDQCSFVDVFLAPSQFAVDKHREFGFRHEMVVLPNFLFNPDNESGSGDRVSESDDRPFFLFVGRLERIKGLHDVIPLFAAADSTELWIAGRGSDEPHLRRLAEGLSRVRFLGQQSAEQLRDLYRRALGVVLPSLCYEVFPMVALEAFREGTPVIARRLGPFPEIIQQGGGGLLFGTRDELGRCLERLAGDTTLRDRLGSAGRLAFEEHWSEEVVLQRYLEVIAGVSRGKGPER